MNGRAFVFDDPTEIADLLCLIIADSKAGRMVQDSRAHGSGASLIYDIRFTLADQTVEDPEILYLYRLSVYSDCPNTIAYLNALVEKAKAEYKEPPIYVIS